MAVCFMTLSLHSPRGDEEPQNSITHITHEYNSDPDPDRSRNQDLLTN
jgi:hypothetical protein